jgi:hypothetical protein
MTAWKVVGIALLCQDDVTNWDWLQNTWSSQIASPIYLLSIFGLSFVSTWFGSCGLFQMDDSKPDLFYYWWWVGSLQSCYWSWLGHTPKLLPLDGQCSRQRRNMISKLPVENHTRKEVAQKHCLRLWMISSCPPRIASSLRKQAGYSLIFFKT